MGLELGYRLSAPWAWSSVTNSRASLHPGWRPSDPHHLLELAHLLGPGDPRLSAQRVGGAAALEPLVASRHQEPWVSSGRVWLWEGCRPAAFGVLTQGATWRTLRPSQPGKDVSKRGRRNVLLGPLFPPVFIDERDRGARRHQVDAGATRRNVHFDRWTTILDRGST